MKFKERVHVHETYKCIYMYIHTRTGRIDRNSDFIVSGY